MPIKQRNLHIFLLTILLRYTGFLGYILYVRGGSMWYQHSLKYIGDYERSVHYVVNHDLPQSLVDSPRWYQMAAAQGYPPAKYLLGLSYFHGMGAPKSQNKAFYWIKKSALAS